MATPITNLIDSFMAPKYRGELDTIAHISKTANGANWRLEDDLPAHKQKGYHRHHQYTSPEGFPEVPRQYISTAHGNTQDYSLYAANSYASAIAVAEDMKKRGF